MIIVRVDGRLLDLVALIDPSHKSHNAPDTYPTKHHFVKEMCTFMSQNGHCG